MPQYKKRILFVNEFSKLHTGYATYGNEILSRLYKSGEYEVAELACYAMPAGLNPDNDNKLRETPWKVYPNLPANDQEKSLYEQNVMNEFGAWKFEQTCLDFQPDIVLDIRDYWMDAFIDMSPFRRFYKTIFMPTVDGTPQQAEWISLYKNIDVVFAYNGWSAKILEDEGGGLINLQGTTPPSANIDAFKFINNKKQHKTEMGINPDWFILGMVARNQRRKLFPDFADAFNKLLNELSPQQRNNTFMYWHTSYPDLGWNLPKYLKDNGIGSKVLFTYICHNCKFFTPLFYRDVATICPRCRTRNMTLPTTHMGLSPEELGKVNGLFDIYVQYVTNEGFGMPIIESAFCGNPIFATDYSAMENVVRNLQGFPIKPKTLFYECETGRKMALPDNDDLVRQVKLYMALPESLKNKKRYETYTAAMKHYSSWDNVYLKWKKAIDEMPVNPEGWKSPPLILPGLAQIPSPQECPDERFVAMAIQAYIGDPRLINNFAGLRLYRDLMWGRTTENQAGGIYNDMCNQGMRPKHADFNRQKVIQILDQFRNNNNNWELARYQKLGIK